MWKMDVHKANNIRGCLREVMVTWNETEDRISGLFALEYLKLVLNLILGFIC